MRIKGETMISQIDLKIAQKSLKVNCLILLTLNSLLILSCGKSFTDEIEVKQLSSTLEITVEEESEVGQYRVKFKPLENIKYSIFKQDYLSNDIIELAVGVSGIYYDSKILSGRIYNYEIGIFREDKIFHKIQEQDIKIPTDLRLKPDESVVLTPDQSNNSNKDHKFVVLNRVSLSQGSKIITNGEKLILSINRIISSGGVLSTYQPDQTAKVGEHGRSGNDLIVEINYINGPLNFEMRGEHGGEGIRPKSLGEIGRGNKGLKGTDGEAEVYRLGMTGGIREEICLKRPSAGTEGGKGLKGIKANPGLNGGNSGSVFIDIKQSDNFTFNYSFHPGRGGHPSLGGEGGPGGFAGDSGGEVVYNIDEDLGPTFTSRNDPPRICNTPQGLQGPSGDDGETNTRGLDGVAEKVCIRKNLKDEIKCFDNN